MQVKDRAYPASAIYLTLVVRQICEDVPTLLVARTQTVTLLLALSLALTVVAATTRSLGGVGGWGAGVTVTVGAGAGVTVTVGAGVGGAASPVPATGTRIGEPAALVTTCTRADFGPAPVGAKATPTVQAAPGAMLIP